MNLHHLLLESARKWPDNIAVQDAQKSYSYREMDTLAGQLASALAARGVHPGDRVGIWLEKSALTLAMMQGALRLHAVYVPLDPLSPPARIEAIIRDCGIRMLCTSPQRAELLSSRKELAELRYLFPEEAMAAERALIAIPAADDDLAYILYTSGSTGTPKGVCISHRNALSFVNWAIEELRATSADRFSNHAPFHFDLSVLDIYGAFAVGAAVLLIPEGISYMPVQLIEFLQTAKPTIWYSVPSVLTLMLEQGNLLEHELPALRVLLFAGEPFPIKHLRRLYQHWPGVRFLNLYGPTETNVCTFYEVTHIADDETAPVPIGRACSGDQVWGQKEDGTPIQPGETGELMVSGPTVMLGYWGKEPHGKRPYPTGDLVTLEPDGNYRYLGRRDHMVKVRGYRIEIGDIEAALLAHPAISATAVLTYGEGISARLAAFISCNESEPPSLLELKKHCAQRLPRYMIIDEVHPLPSLPFTRNGKIDRLALKTMLTQRSEDHVTQR
uniref:D-alanine--poly(Phosphoribitol) ligase n=1 Tax=Thermosporothrix sp. COM3 TaxID=2490863 RepID=A0A455SHX2_9CHLR|nr:D-alanine--poly(phosphoribitol) ligase [Thermosporothrix sp. COM3]